MVSSDTDFGGRVVNRRRMRRRGASALHSLRWRATTVWALSPDWSINARQLRRTKAIFRFPRVRLGRRSTQRDVARLRHGPKSGKTGAPCVHMQSESGACNSRARRSAMALATREESSGHADGAEHSPNGRSGLSNEGNRRLNRAIADFRSYGLPLRDQLPRQLTESAWRELVEFVEFGCVMTPPLAQRHDDGL